MSNIFDALQRAETESSTQGSTLTLATELLEAAEQKLRDSASTNEPATSPARVESFEVRPVISVRGFGSVSRSARLNPGGKSPGLVG